jgi:ATP-dependent DNA ligase
MSMGSHLMASCSERVGRGRGFSSAVRGALNGARRHTAGPRPVFACDLLRLDGEDLRPLPLEERRARLRKAFRDAGKALRFSEHLEATEKPSSVTLARWA